MIYKAFVFESLNFYKDRKKMLLPHRVMKYDFALRHYISSDVSDLSTTQSNLINSQFLTTQQFDVYLATCELCDAPIRQ